MTTIYELEKQATPGPFARADFEDYPGDPHSVCRMAEPDRRIAELVTENEADDLLWVHCRNRFMEALEALKEKGHDEGCMATIGGRCECGFNKLIKKLETVE